MTIEAALMAQSEKTVLHLPSSRTGAEAHTGRRTEGLATIAQIRRLTHLASADLIIEELVCLALRELSEAVRCRRCSMLLLNDDLGDILVESQHRADGEGEIYRIGRNGKVPKFLIPTRGKVTEHILRTRRPLLVEDISRDPRFGGKRDRPYPSRAFASAPLIVDGNVLAIMNATDKENVETLSEDDLRVVEIFADHLALKLHNQIDDVAELFRRAHADLHLTAEKEQIQSQLVDAKRAAERRKAQLSTIQVLAGLLQTDFVLEELAKMIVKLVAQSTGATKTSVLIIDDKRGDLLMRGAAGSGQVETLRLPRRGKVTEKVLHEKSSILVEGSGEKPANAAGHYKTDSYVVVPVLYRENIRAIICATDKEDQSPFDKEDMRFLELLAAQVAVTLNDFRMRERAFRQRALDRELRIAGEIQKNLLPLSLPGPQGVQLAAASRPAGFVGGDFYDVFPLGTERYAIAIADVAGKGIPAALVMVMITTFLRTLRSSELPPAEIMARLNEYLDAHMEKNLFATMLYAVLDAKNRTLVYTNAGHCFPLLFRRGDQEPRELAGSTFPLAVFPSVEFETSVVSLEPGDVVLMFTDGLTDAHNVKDELFGKQAIVDYVMGSQDASAEEIVRGLLEQTKEFSAGRDPYDDITILAARVEE